jgi:hypothetical protein
VETYLRFFVNHQQNNWVEYLPLAKFAHNNWRSETTWESPFFLLMGYHPRADWHQTISDLPLASTRLDQLKKIRDDAQHHMTWAQTLWIKHKAMPRYKAGDQVWLEGHNLHTKQPAAKLAPRRHSPFAIIQVMSPVSYRLDLPPQWKIHPVFHIDLRTPYRETEVHGVNYQCPPPELIDNEEEYEVEAILDSRRMGRGRKLQYLIKWKGYSDADNQWEDHQNVAADDLIHQFQWRNPTKETHLRRMNADESLSNCPMSSPAQLTSNPSDIVITFTTCNRCGSTADYCHCDNDNVDSPRWSPFSEDAVLVPTLDDIGEARALFPTPEPGRLSPDSAHTTRIELGDTTEVCEVGVDERDEQMEEGTTPDSPPSYGQAETIYPDCHCSTDGGEYCHCAERCTRGAGEACERRGRGPCPPTTRCPPNPQQAPRILEEFWLNVPLHYVPFKIIYNSCEVKAKYVTIHMTNNPYALGMTAPGAPVYR